MVGAHELACAFNRSARRDAHQLALSAPTSLEHIRKHAHLLEEWFSQLARGFMTLRFGPYRRPIKSRPLSYRAEITANKQRSGLIAFLNTSLGLWILSSIFLSLGSWSYTVWTENRAEAREKAERTK